jgi:hypothetical protein
MAHSGSSLSMAFRGLGRIIMLCASASAQRHVAKQQHSSLEPLIYVTTGINSAVPSCQLCAQALPPQCPDSWLSSSLAAKLLRGG